MTIDALYLNPPFPSAVAIYALVDPRDGETRYIGKSVNPARRYKKHVRSSNQHPEFYSSRWIATLQRAGLQPLLRVLDWVSAECWQRAEAHYIAVATAAGARLTNSTKGGEGLAGLRPTAAGRAKLSRAQSGRWAHTTHEERARITAPMQAARSSPEPLAAQAALLALRDSDPEAYKALRSAASRKAYATRRERGHVPVRRPRPSKKRRPGQAVLGSPEHRAKQSAALSGRTLTTAHRAKIGAALKGRQFSEESRAKMSASARTRARRGTAKGAAAMTDGDYQAPVPPDEQINPSPTYPQAPPLPGTPDPFEQPDRGSTPPPQQPQADQASIPQEPQPDAGTPNPYPQSEQADQGSTPGEQPDPWTISDVPADAPDETEQAGDAESAQE